MFLCHDIGANNVIVHCRTFALKPGQQRGVDIISYPGIIIGYPVNEATVIKDPGGSIGLVALIGNTIVPVMPGINRILTFNQARPGIFPRRLVKVSMNADFIRHTFDHLAISIRLLPAEAG